MKKILLIGELGDVIRSINECLSTNYAIQLCSKQLDNVKGMTKIIKPDMIIIVQLGMESKIPEIFAWLAKECKKIPILVITTKDEWVDCSDYCKEDNYAVMYRPVQKKDLMEKCRNMLEYYGQEDAREDEKYKVLIVDDSPIVLRNLKSLLEDKYTIFLSKSGEQALKMIPEKQPDLILLDYEMPGMDGKETFEAILQDENMKDIPVIFLTGVSKKSQIIEVLKSVPAGYILKPPNRDKIIETIEEVMSGKEESDEI